MFTFSATPVKFVGLLVMFAYTTGWGVYQLTRPADRRTRVSGLLHLWMSVVMLLMVPRSVWQPFVKVVPLPLIAATQALSVVWFAWFASKERADRSLAAHFAGHATMFAAMTWHLIAMSVKMPHMGTGMAAWVAEESKAGGVLWTVALIGVPFMAWLLYAGVRSLIEAVAPARTQALEASDHHDHAHHDPAHEVHGQHDHAAMTAAMTSGGTAVALDRDVARPLLEVAGCHEPQPVGSPLQRLGRLHDAAMNLGMFWMSTGLMVALLPFMSVFAF